MDTYLDKIELQGFKSFPDRTVIKLHEGITAIVGPNGCGKSNIVDAVLWVLGEQKIKNLRGETNEDLIFSGSSTQKPLGMTEVGAYFKHQDEENYIARRYFRSDETKYILNDKICRNRDIMDKLYEMGIGDKKYFIFEQGSIDKLIALKPSEKRILIEEAANISHYLNRKKQTAQKLIIAEQNLTNVEILLRDKEERLRELKNQVSYCKRYRRLKQEKLSHLKHFISREYGELKERLKKTQSAMEAHLSDETVQKREISHLEGEIIRQENEKWGEEKRVKEIQKKRFDISGQIYTVSGGIDQTRQEIRFLEQKSAELQEDVRRGEAEIEEMDSRIEKDTREKTRREKELARHREEDQVAGNLQAKNRLKTGIEKQLAEIKQAVFPLQADLSSLSNDIMEMEKKLAQTGHEIQSKVNFIGDLQEQIERENQGDLLKNREALKREIQTRQDRLLEITSRNQTGRSEVAAGERQIIELNNEIANLSLQKDKYREVKDKLAGISEQTSRIRDLGKIPDLIRSDPENHPVLENFYRKEMGAAAIADHSDFTEKDLGEQDYLLGKTAPDLDSLLPELQKEKGFVATIKDLYSLSVPRVKECLRDGILVDTLQNALRIFLRYPIDIVTRAGTLITRDGILSKNREKGILNVIREIQKIEEKVERLTRQRVEKEEALKTLVSRLQEGENEEQEATRRVAEMEKKYLQLDTEVKTIERAVETSRARIEVNRSEIGLLREQKNRLEAQLKAREEKKDALARQSATLADRRAGLTRELESVTGEINRLEKNSMEKRSERQILEQKIDFIKSNLQNLEQEREKQQSLLVRHRRGIEDNKKKTKDLQENLGVLQKDLSVHQKSLGDLDKQIGERDSQVAELTRKIQEASVRLKKRREGFEEVMDRKNRIEIELSDIKREIFLLQERAFKELNTELESIEPQEALRGVPLDELKEKLEGMEHRLVTMNESNRLNFSAESEHDLLEKDYKFHVTQREDILKSIGNMNQAIEKIDRESIVSFKEAFEAVKTNFIKNFKILFEGGEAKIELLDEGEDLLESGLEIKAQPPGKRLVSLRLLSGGEKTLTSLAFLFSLFEYKPSPFCVFDEVDAALDEANIERFLKFLHKLKEKTQFLIITHNFKTMEEVDYLYGVSMDEPGISKVYSVKMSEQRERLKQNLTGS